MVLDCIFKGAGKAVTLDRDRLLSKTSIQFVRIVEAKIDAQPVKDIRMHGDRRQGFMYFKVGGRQYAFAYDKITHTLIFSEIIRGKWEFIIGYKSL